MDLLRTLENLIRNLNKENIELSVVNTMNLYDANYPYSFQYIICSMIFSTFFSQNNEFDKFLSYLKALQTKETEIKSKIIDIFTQYLTNKYKQESFYLLEKMIEEKLIDSSVTQNVKSSYFEHYRTTRRKRNEYNPCPFSDKFKANLKDLKKGNWKLHKQLIKQGINPNEISKIIRNDEIEKLQEISSQNDFNFNQIIEPSLYERCSFINKENVTLIDYAAFFGSIKCFKYLLINKANVNNAGKYAIAGGNREIVHLCEQNHSSFNGASQTAIKFHQNDLFHYLYDNKLEKFSDQLILKYQNKLKILVRDDIIHIFLEVACIRYNNYEILSFLQNEYSNVHESVIRVAIKYGNFFLVKYFYDNNHFPKTFTSDFLKSKNNELINYIINYKGIDYDFDPVILFYYMFVLII